MKTKAAAFVLLFAILSIVSIFSVVMYQQVLAQDDEVGELLSQVKITKIEYNSSDPFVVTGTPPNGSFLCNFTYYLPDNSTYHLPLLDLHYYLQTPTDQYEIAGACFASRRNTLDNSDPTITAELHANSYRLPETKDTVSVFHVTTAVMQGTTALEISTEATGNKIENTVIGRANQDQTNGLLTFYSSTAVYVWIIGLGLASGFMVFTSKSPRQIERWAASIFLLNLCSVITGFILTLLPLPGSTMPLIEASAASILYYLFLVIIYGTPNLILFLTLFFKSRVNRGAVWVICGLTIAVFALSAGGGLLAMGGVSFWTFAIIALINAVALIRLERNVIPLKMPQAVTPDMVKRKRVIYTTKASLGLSFVLAGLFLLFFGDRIFFYAFSYMLSGLLFILGLILIAYTPEGRKTQPIIETVFGALTFFASIALGFLAELMAIFGGYSQGFLFFIVLAVFALVSLFLSILVLRKFSSKLLWYALMAYLISILAFSLILDYAGGTGISLIFGLPAGAYSLTFITYFLGKRRYGQYHVGAALITRSVFVGIAVAVPVLLLLIQVLGVPFWFTFGSLNTQNDVWVDVQLYGNNIGDNLTVSVMGRLTDYEGIGPRNNMSYAVVTIEPEGMKPYNVTADANGDAYFIYEAEPTVIRAYNGADHSQYVVIPQNPQQWQTKYAMAIVSAAVLGFLAGFALFKRSLRGPQKPS